jgi:hypothetical protein
MDTFLLILRIFFIVIGSLVGLFYILFQCYQKMQPASFKLSTPDYIVFIAVALLFGFGTNDYFGLLAFLPLWCMQLCCRYFIKPKYLSGSGRWMEIDWKKLPLKGFEGFLPKEVLNEMNKIPKSVHFIVPRFYLTIFIYFIRKKIAKEMGGSQKSIKMTAAQQNMAMGQFSEIIDGIEKLKSGQIERRNFPFGTIKVTRL